MLIWALALSHIGFVAVSSGKAAIDSPHEAVHRRPGELRKPVFQFETDHIRIAETESKSTTTARQSSTDAHAIAAQVSTESRSTVFNLDLTKGVTVEVFTLANPYRVVIDLPDVEFDLAPETGQSGAGLVSAFRYGLFAADRARIVIDTKGPVLIHSANMNNLPENAGVRLAIKMRATDVKSFAQGTGANRGQDQDRNEDQSNQKANTPKKGDKPIIMIDPGHGGIDSGARGANDLLEKTIALEVGKKLQEMLAKNHQYSVHMTRNTDVFVSLDSRIRKSQQAGAELFLSIHADSISETQWAQSVSGARIYTLSERASDEQARLMAEKENSSDAMAGLVQEARTTVQEVRDILIDLMKRETANFSSELSSALVQKMKASVQMSRAPQRAAAFKVLKQTNTPSVLIELGFLSNASDEKLMSSDEWQYKAARSIASAIDLYFTQRVNRAP